MDVKYKISKHAAERYSERVMEKEGIDINRSVTLNEEKIQTDINKLIEFADRIYTGRQSQKDGKGNVIDVYLNGCWVILVDSKQSTVVTLYKVDLGLGDEFNNVYVSKMRERLNASQEALEATQKQVDDESTMYRKMIEDAEGQIKEYRSMINNLEELCTGYKTIIDNNSVKVTQANRDVADVVNQLVSKKEF